MVTLSEYRKLELQELAEAISMEYATNSVLQPEIVATDNKITYSYGAYQNAFDGLLEHKTGRFHIYLNTDRIPKDHPRMRFTFSHELGHYFIDEHRNALKSGKVPSHPSFNAVISKTLVEREADHFAACLLMPSSRVRKFCLKKPLSSKLIADLSEYFQTSTSSVLFRYMELSLFPMMMVMCSGGKVDWKLQTSDFKYKYLAGNGKLIPPSTAAGEFFQKGVKYDSEEIVFADEWFSDFGRIRDEAFYEKCYYLTSSRVLSLLWKKER